MAAGPPRVFAAIQQVRPREIAGYGWVRPLTPLSAERPLYAQMLGAGYTLLGTVPLREVVLGRVGSLTRPFAAEPRAIDRRAFADYAERGRVKILLGFRLHAEPRAGAPGTRVTASLYLWDAADPSSHRLRLLWPAVAAAGGWGARSFLAALGRRVADAPGTARPKSVEPRS